MQLNQQGIAKAKLDRSYVTTKAFNMELDKSIGQKEPNIMKTKAFAVINQAQIKSMVSTKRGVEPMPANANSARKSVNSSSTLQNQSMRKTNRNKSGVISTQRNFQQHSDLDYKALESFQFPINVEDFGNRI